MNEEQESIIMMGNLEIDKSAQKVVVSVNPKIYPIKVVVDTAEIYSEKYDVAVDGDPEEEYLVEIQFKKEEKNKKGKELEGELIAVGREFNNLLIKCFGVFLNKEQNKKLNEMIHKRVLLVNNEKESKNENLIKNED
jgi:hypothetical protein